jgi:hypothetical protein
LLEWLGETGRNPQRPAPNDLQRQYSDEVPALPGDNYAGLECSRISQPVIPYGATPIIRLE